MLLNYIEQERRKKQQNEKMYRKFTIKQVSTFHAIHDQFVTGWITVNISFWIEIYQTESYGRRKVILLAEWNQICVSTKWRGRLALFIALYMCKCVPVDILT